MKRILAIIVLYKMTAEDSPTFVELSKFLKGNDAASESIELMVCDNTPYKQTAPVDFSGSYIRDSTNPGLAEHYNLALRRAEELGGSWLMLLDQDTTVTAEYVEEALQRTATLATDDRIAALVPKLVMNGILFSPHLPGYGKRAHPVDRNLTGVPGTRLVAFGSGALVKVSALREIGGFPEKFWLDFLDHATFLSLQDTGREIFVMHSALRHDVSAEKPDKQNDPAYPARFENVLDAGLGLFQEYGSFRDRLLYRIGLWRLVIGSFRRGWFRLTLRALKVAVRHTPHLTRPRPMKLHRSDVTRGSTTKAMRDKCDESAGPPVVR
jgi:GT2 family glycosyltransferase